MGDYECQVWRCIVVLAVLASFKISHRDGPLVLFKQADDDCVVEVVGIEIYI
jgi:hypothetical protein